jgi:hypothetical protein
MTFTKTQDATLTFRLVQRPTSHVAVAKPTQVVKSALVVRYGVRNS